MPMRLLHIRHVTAWILGSFLFGRRLHYSRKREPACRDGLAHSRRMEDLIRYCGRDTLKCRVDPARVDRREEAYDFSAACDGACHRQLSSSDFPRPVTTLISRQPDEVPCRSFNWLCILRLRTFRYIRYRVTSPMGNSIRRINSCYPISFD